MIYPRRLLKNIKASILGRSIALEYAWKGIPRYSQKKPISIDLLKLCDQNIPLAEDLIAKIILNKSELQSIPIYSKSEDGVFWLNNFLAGLDMVTLYTIISEYNPTRIIEIGSGHSTAVMRSAIRAGKLQSKITCIDPNPRRDIQDLADRWIPNTLEDLKDLSFFADLSKGDIVFFDGSHISLANSDVTVFFLEVLPMLPPGVIVHIHDIYLPYDYPLEMIQRGYNEQYLLSLALTLGEDKFEVIFPAFYTYNRKEAQNRLNEYLWKFIPDSHLIEKHGGSFWFKIKS